MHVHHRVRWLTAWVLLMTFLAGTASASERRYGTIILHDGTRLEDATFRVDERLRIVRVDGDGAERLLLFDAIERIEIDGADVTDDVLVRQPLNPEPRRRSGEDAGWVAVDAAERRDFAPAPKPFDLSLAVLGTGGLGFGDFYEGLDPGFGIGVEATLPVSADYGVRLALSRTWLRTEDFPTSVFDPESGSTLTIDADFRETLFTASGVAFFIEPDPSDALPTFGIVHGGLGLIVHEVCATAEVTGGSLEASNAEECASETDFVITGGIGGSVPIDAGVRLDASLNGLIVYYDSISIDGQEITSVTLYLEARIGLAAVF